MPKIKPDTLEAVESESTLLVLIFKQEDETLTLYADNRRDGRIDINGMTFPGCGEIALRFRGLDGLGGSRDEDGRKLDRVQIVSAWEKLTDLATLLRASMEHCPPDLQEKINTALEKH